MKTLFLLLSLILYPLSFAWAVPAFNNAVVASGVNVTAISSSFTTSGTNRFMLGCAFGFDANTAFTYNAVAATSVTSFTNPAALIAQMWRLVNPATGSNAYNFTFAGVTSPTIAVMSFTDVHQTTSVGTAVTQGTGAAEQSASVTVTSATDELAADCFGFGTDVLTSTLGATQTLRWGPEVNADIAWTFDGSTKAGAASVSMARDWDSSFQYMSLIAIPLKPVAAAPSGVARRRVRIND